MTRVADNDLDARSRAAETKKRRTRERAINATLNLFAPGTVGDGRNVPTIEQIAEEGGVGVATIYTHFGTKYGLYLAALGQAFELLIRSIRAEAQSGTYEPPDMRGEIIAYVYNAAVIAENHRYLVASYIQAYFENGIYDQVGDSRLSSPIQPGLSELISYGQEFSGPRFRPNPTAVSYHMDMLLLLTCANDVHSLRSPEYAVSQVLASLLPSVDREYQRDDFISVNAQLERLAFKDAMALRRQESTIYVSEPELSELIRENTAALLGYTESGEVASDSQFAELGVDSVVAVELSRRLSSALGVRLPVTLVFEHPTPTAVARYLHQLKYPAV